MKKFKNYLKVNYFHLQGYSITQIATQTNLKSGHVRKLIIR